MITYLAVKLISRPEYAKCSPSGTSCHSNVGVKVVDDDVIGNDGVATDDDDDVEDSSLFSGCGTIITLLSLLSVKKVNGFAMKFNNSDIARLLYCNYTIIIEAITD